MQGHWPKERIRRTKDSRREINEWHDCASRADRERGKKERKITKRGSCRDQCLYPVTSDLIVYAYKTSFASSISAQLTPIGRWGLTGLKIMQVIEPATHKAGRGAYLLEALELIIFHREMFWAASIERL